MFDNGNYHNPPFSRALEYKIDETSKIATLVWQFQDNPQVYGGFMGYVQRLSNGNTLISWGGTNPSVTEVNPYGLKVLEFSLPTNIFSYRASEVENNPSNPMVNIIPNNFILKQNYPNPFNPTTKIDYYIPENSNVNLNVYDLTGRLIATLVNANQFLGYHEVEFDSRNLSSGIYFYRLEANNFTETKKLVVLK